MQEEQDGQEQGPSEKAPGSPTTKRPQGLLRAASSSEKPRQGLGTGAKASFEAGPPSAESCLFGVLHPEHEIIFNHRSGCSHPPPARKALPARPLSS